MWNKKFYRINCLNLYNFNFFTFLWIPVSVQLVPLVQRADNDLQRINCYPTDRCCQNVLRYLPDREIYLVDRFIHPSNNRGLCFVCMYIQSTTIRYNLNSVAMEVMITKTAPTRTTTTTTTRCTRTNHQYKLYVKPARLNCYKHSFFIRIVKLWNELPRNIVEADNLQHFKSQLKLYLNI